MPKGSFGGWNSPFHCHLSKSALVEKMVGFAKYDENLRDMICRVVKNTGICLSFYDVKFEKFERRNLSFSCVYIL